MTSPDSNPDSIIGDIGNAIGNAAGDAGNAVGSAVGSAASTALSAIAGPITTWFAAKTAWVSNMLNQIFNTCFYGALAVGGGFLLYKGISDLTGASVSGSAFGLADFFAKSDPETRPIAKVAESAVKGSVKSSGPKVDAPKIPVSNKVDSPKVKIPKEKAPKIPKPKFAEGEIGPKEKAARAGGLGAAQILRARKEDRAA
jgi:hypothetical protein